ncbi:TauD/TfdA family dioxygenase [Pseudomonadales bacterium]|nr:TauD/TfdA family dioxygenase [Pseudomonadales bacterium]
MLWLDRRAHPQQQRENPSAEHPVIRTHPVTHQKCLFVNSGFTKRIKGVTKAESDALLRLLFEHVKNPNFHCRLQWRPNTIAIWDNRCTQHMGLLSGNKIRREGHSER